MTDAEDTAQLKPHPAFEHLEKEGKEGFPPIPRLAQRMKPGGRPITITSDNAVVGGLGSLNFALRKGQRTVPVRRLAFPADHPRALLACLSEAASFAPLSDGEAARITHNINKILSQIPEHAEKVHVVGLIEGLFRLYWSGNENGRIPHKQALALSRDVPHAVQECILEEIRQNPLRALALAEAKKGLLEKEESRATTQAPDALIDGILQNPDLRAALFSRLISLAHPLDAVQLSDILTNLNMPGKGA